MFAAHLHLASSFLVRNSGGSLNPVDTKCSELLWEKKIMCGLYSKSPVPQRNAWPGAYKSS